MSRAFPQNFDLRLFDGPRAKQFSRPEDAFQQLVGDALKEMAGQCAHISPTRGRDGSIDAFLLDGAPLSGPFEGLHMPVIVECKTHDEAVKHIDRNILGQWQLMKKKLETNAQSGWKDLFEPWLHARGYAYCVSSQIPEQLRVTLTASIQKFFAALPTDQRPPIDSLRVIDWNDLRQWLEASPRVADLWLGIELDLILDHQTYLQRLSGFREYLLSSKLEFVPPTRDAPFHPEQVLEEIEKANEKHGTLLVGAGGVGKTRTAIEVATLAANAGWRVLHVLPDEPGVETEDIVEIVLPYRDSRTLLVFDYIDQMQRLDLGSIRRSLIPAALDRGIQLRLLANSRLGWMELTNPERDALFRVTELRPTDHQKTRLVETMAGTVAPTASGTLGQSEVIRLCGTRAIIALLIARELENRAVAGLLMDLNTATLRSGDLVQWLRRRLQENALSMVQEGASLVPTRPEAPMVAAAAALSCAPETQENLIVAAGLAYRHLGWPTSNQDAQYLVNLLLKLGWLEAHAVFVSTAHDVVADEVLDQTIHTERIIFEREFAAVVSFAFELNRGIGRLATVLRRVVASARNESSVEALQVFLVRWLNAHATHLGRVLQAGDPNLTGYALGAILSGPPWDQAAMQQWDQLVLPWLDAHSIKEEARHLLYKGLRNVPADQAALVPLALLWLNVHGLAHFATFVIAPLLDRAELSSVNAQQATRFALSWLEQHRDTRDAGFILKRLLELGDLSTDQAQQGSRFALNWLLQHRDTRDAGFILSRLLERGDLSAGHAQQACRFALSWLVQHGDTLDAKFVLRKLLERGDLSADPAEQACRFALSWLQQHGDTLEAQFVLRPLLERSDLSADYAQQAFRFALSWLKQHGDKVESQFVLRPLLERGDLSADCARQACRFALSWLKQHCDNLESQFVLAPLLERGGLSTDHAQQACRFALSWLKQHRDALPAGFILKRLLERSDLSSDDVQQTGRFALSWLAQHHETLDAGFVLPSLLDQRQIQGDDATFLVESAVKWLQTFYQTIDAEFVLEKVLRRYDVPTNAKPSLFASAIARLRQRLSDDDATYLLRSCLEYRFEDETHKRELVSLAIDWLEIHAGNPNGDYVWNRVLSYHPDLLSDAEWLRVARQAMLWLKRKRVSDSGVDRTTNSLLNRAELLEPGDAEFVVRLAIELLGTDLHEQGRRRMTVGLERLVPLLRERRSTKDRD